MEFMELAKERYSVRKYKDTKLTQEQIDRLLEVSNLAPTGKNNQPHRIYVLQSDEALAKINEITPCAFHAPVVFMFTYNKDEDWKNAREEGIHSGIEDVSIGAKVNFTTQPRLIQLFDKETGNNLIWYDAESVAANSPKCKDYDF